MSVYSCVCSDGYKSAPRDTRMWLYVVCFCSTTLQHDLVSTKVHKDSKCQLSVAAAEKNFEVLT